MSTKPIFLIDHRNTAFRMFYGMPPLTDKEGNGTQAVYGYLKTLAWFCERSKRDYGCEDPIIIICDDTSSKTSIRKQMYEQYKGQREKVEHPDDLKRQMDLIIEVLKNSGATIMKMDGYEADDIIGSIAKKYSDQHDIIICSSDKDLSQLINKRTFIYDGVKKKMWTQDNIFSRFDVLADNIVDYLALVWDKSDNIPWVAWIGPKGAVSIISAMGGIDEIYSIIEDEEKLEKLVSAKLVTKGNIKKLIDWKEDAFFSKKLIQLFTDLEVEVSDKNSFSINNISQETLDTLSIKSIKPDTYY